MNEERVREVFSDEEFVKSLLELETPEEVQKALAEKDVDLSIEEIRQIAELVEKKASGELTDEDLENVAGGVIVADVICAVCAVIRVGCAITSLVHRLTRRW